MGRNRHYPTRSVRIDMSKWICCTRLNVSGKCILLTHTHIHTRARAHTHIHIYCLRYCLCVCLGWSSRHNNASHRFINNCTWCSIKVAKLWRLAVTKLKFDGDFRIILRSSSCAACANCIRGWPLNLILAQHRHSWEIYNFQ